MNSWQISFFATWAAIIGTWCWIALTPSCSNSREQIGNVISFKLTCGGYRPITLLKFPADWETNQGELAIMEMVEPAKPVQPRI